MYWDRREYFDFKDLVGKTFISIENQGDELIFTESDGTIYNMRHDKDCCESVELEDICGDFNNLLNTPIIMAEESSNSDMPAKDEWDESYTWTFYKLATINGYVTLRWYGTSNGYYSESVDFYKIIKNEM